MLKHRNITVERIEKYFKSDMFYDVNLQSFLEEIVDESIAITKYAVPNLQRIPFGEAMKGVYVPAKVGDQITPTWSTHWFKLEITIPKSMEGRKVYLIFDPSCEGLVWSDKGEPLQGLTGDFGLDRHVDFDLTNGAPAGQKFTIYIEVGANGMFGAGFNGMINAPDPNKSFALKTVKLVCFNELARSIYWDLEVLLGIVKEMPVESQLGNDALFTANSIVNTIRNNEPATLVAAKEIGSKFFKVRKKELGYVSHAITAIGNCHIDTAWLWPYDETKRKIARSWATQCRLLEQNPEYTFAASQAQQFEWLEQLYPSLFEKITGLVKTGRFVPIGGTWVEMDCNVPSGEAFCRQFLYGQNYFYEKFGFRHSVFWLPDTFGYSSQLPQILTSAGLKYFFTQKLSWNNINKFPHTSFYWKGLDGTSVLTHFSPADTYTAQASVKDAVFAVANNKDKQYSNKNGDGGGGPLLPMIERIKRFGNIEGLPSQTKFGDPTKFYEELETTSTGLNTWKGELYFELHRGTYTTHGLVKKYNRYCEYLLRAVEILWALCLAQKKTKTYPKAEIDRLWKLVLLNQFHDVLPGSSIGLVYVDAIKFYEDVTLSGTKLKKEALKLLMGEGTKTIATNLSPWPVPGYIAQIPIANNVQYQQYSSDKKYGLAYVPPIAPLSGVLLQETAPSFDSQVKVESLPNRFIVDNGLIQASFDEHGRLFSLIDREVGRETVLSNSLGNVFRFYEDIPLFWDAWDVEIYHLEKSWEAGLGKISVEEAGPLRVVLKVIHPISKTSTLEQRTTISAGSKLVNFENEIFWQESRKIIKVEFPVNVECDYATFETQFGYIQRPTHFNNSWDMAKFEVCAHKFVDYSEYGYGVALLNDRSPKSPDDKADLGRQTFKYALLPHKGSFLESDVVREAYQYNVPVEILSGAGSFQEAAFFNVTAKNLVIDTIKPAENFEKSKLFVVRMYEAYGGRGIATLSSSFKLAEVYLSNVIEETHGQLPITDNAVELEYMPFKMITLLVKIE
ncbi:Alpha-mannosidase 2C1 [Boothiomyces macroporosus]|uniref:alpha-mannosidase n=1 Tax=Boothiomyces macroporosus TaxID=261099 RepID=A0AAD5UMI1_9FUNG|nr:Alpha-mannosidase 2C1 [Boothiomyces macroporosus]